MNCLLDASAIMALLGNERGSDIVEAALPEAGVSAVNAAEVLTILVRKGASAEEALYIFGKLNITVLDFDLADAAATARMTTLATRARGLSLGDRACLGSALQRNVRVLTADRNWCIPALGVEVECIR